MLRAALAVLMLVPLIVAGSSPAVQAQLPPVGASAELHDAGGKRLAVATFRQASDQVLITLTFPDRSALTGTHAIQIHQVGRCDPPDFASAGPIFNPTGKQHGLLNPNGPMAGDLPSLVIGAAGVGTYNISAPLVSIGPGGSAALLGGQGTSLILFARQDDDQSQPEGNAGARIACGVIVAGPPGTPAAGALGVGGGSGGPDLLGSAVIALMGGLLIAGGVVLRRA